MTTTLQTQLQQLRTELNTAFFEREDAVEAYLLALLTGEHIFVLGPPGTGKSDITDTLAAAFTGANYFKCAMSKTRSKDDVFGPIDVLELRNTGHLFRKDTGYITTTDLAFIDEIGKMSGVLGHDMLAALNEREKHQVNGGLSVHRIPLSTAFCCSNEVPTDESDDAAALWDRLLFRVVVDYIKSGRDFAAMLRGGMGQVSTKIDWADMQQAIATDVPHVQIPEAVIKAVMVLRKKLGEQSIHISDRRWRKSMKALQARAFLDGRSEVLEEDLVALRFTLWDTLPQLEEITKLTSAASNPFVEKLLQAKSNLQELAKGLEARRDHSTTEKSDYAKELQPKLAAVRGLLDSLLDEAKGRTIPNFKAVSDLHKELTVSLYADCFGLDRETAEVAAKSKLGKGDGTGGAQ